jgi:hypothetical protein
MHSIMRLIGIGSSTVRKAGMLSALAALAITGAAHAAQVNGDLAVINSGTTSSATSSSLTLNAANYITQATGDFLTLGAQGSDLTSSTATVSGLSTTPTAESIPNYFVFASPDSTIFFGPGTTPSNRFSFDLTSLTETAYLGVNGADFSGAGIVTDSAGVYDPTPATFTIGFSSPTNYSFTFGTVVPEPTTLGLAALSLGGLALRRRRA